MLAIVFTLEKFNHNTSGCKLKIQSNHKPLQSILKKPLVCTPKRLKEMMMRLQKYNIDIHHKRGKIFIWRILCHGRTCLAKSLNTSTQLFFFQCLHQDCARYKKSPSSLHHCAPLKLSCAGGQQNASKDHTKSKHLMEKATKETVFI